MLIPDFVRCEVCNLPFIGEYAKRLAEECAKKGRRDFEFDKDDVVLVQDIGDAPFPGEEVIIKERVPYIGTHEPAYYAHPLGKEEREYILKEKHIEKRI